MRKIKIVCFISLLMFYFFVGVTNIISADTREAYLIITNPGADSSNQMNISWHSDILGTFVQYTEASDTDYSEAITVDGECVANVYKDTIVGDLESYKCGATLEDLNPDTNYIYRVGKDTMSSDYKFETAGTSAFSFTFISDVHVYSKLAGRLNTANTLINNIASVVPNMKLVVAGGDMTAYGTVRQYFEDLSTFKGITDYTYAATPGNHEYYDNSASYVDGSYWNSYFNNPKNGAEGSLNSTYYFKYGNVLFISINSEDTALLSGSDAKQRVWLEEVLKNNNSQFVVAYMHRAMYNGSGTNTSNASMMRNAYQEILDKYGVDLVLGGHDHVYMRTRLIYKNAASTASGVGSYYINNAQVGDRVNSASSSTDNLFVKRIGDVNTAIAFIVSDDTMTVKVFDEKGTMLDSAIIGSKLRNFDTDRFKKKMTLTTAADDFSKVKLTIPEQLFQKSYLLTITDANGKTYLSKRPGEGEVQFNFTGVDNNQKEATYKATFYNKDSSIIEKEFTITNPLLDYGTISNLKVVSSSLTWESDLKNNLITNYEIYVNGDLYKTLNFDATSVSLSELARYVTNSIEVRAVGNGNTFFSEIITYGDESSPVNLEFTKEKDEIESLYQESKQYTLDVFSDSHTVSTLNLNYSSNNEEIATVNNDGVVTFLKPGNVKIKVGLVGRDDVFDEINLEYKLTQIDLTIDEVENLFVGKEKDLVISSNIDGLEYAIISSNQEVIRIQGAKLQGLIVGDSTIKVSVVNRDDVFATVLVECSLEPITIISDNEIDIYPSQIKEILLSNSLEDNSLKYIIQENSENLTCSIENNTLTIKAKKDSTDIQGSCIISIEGRSDCTQTITLNIKQMPALTINNLPQSAIVGEEYTFDISLDKEEFPYNVSIVETDLAKVEDNKITFLKPGNLNFKVELEGFDDVFVSMEIIINEKEEETGCKSIFGLLYTSMLLFGLILIRRKHF